MMDDDSVQLLMCGELRNLLEYAAPLPCRMAQKAKICSPFSTRLNLPRVTQHGKYN